MKTRPVRSFSRLILTHCVAAELALLALSSTWVEMRAQACPLPAEPVDAFRGGFGRGIGMHFGRDMDIDGNTLVVGSLGVAVVYEWRDDRWIHMQTLAPRDNATTAFGFAVAVHQNRIVVTDPSYRGNEGAVWVWEKSGGAWQARPNRPIQLSGNYQPQRNSRFGFSVDLDGDRFLVGSPRYVDPATKKTGLAFLFELSGGTWTARQLQPRASDPDLAGFGHSVALSGRWAAVGMPFAGGEVEKNTGLVSLHEEGSGWIQTHGFEASQTAAEDRFGFSVSLDGDRLVVGAPEHSQPALGGLTRAGQFRSGGAFTFALGPGPDEVREVARIVPDQYCNPYTEGFGYDVDLAGPELIVGAPGSDLGSGLAFIFSEVTPSGGGPSRLWAEKTALVGRGARDLSRFGYSVAVEPSLRTAAAGAPSADMQFGWAFMFADLR